MIEITTTNIIDIIDLINLGRHQEYSYKINKQTIDNVFEKFYPYDHNNKFIEIRELQEEKINYILVNKDAVTISLMINFLFPKTLINAYILPRYKLYYKYYDLKSQPLNIKKWVDFSIKQDKDEINIPPDKIKDSFILANLYYTEQLILYYFYYLIFFSNQTINEIIILKKNQDFIKSILSVYILLIDEQNSEENIIELKLLPEFEKIDDHDDSNKILKVIIRTILYFLNDQEFINGLKKIFIDNDKDSNFLQVYHNTVLNIDKNLALNLENIKLVSKEFLDNL